MQKVIKMKKILNVGGMHCNSCKMIIEDAVTHVKGVKNAKVNLENQTLELEYKYETNLKEIERKLEEKGYSIKRDSVSGMGPLFIALGIAVLLVSAYFFIDKNSESFLNLTSNTSLPLIFFVGFLTGFHCIGMCGGFVLSYTAKCASEGKPSLYSHLQYGAGKLLSYTAIGALFGLVGSVIAFTVELRVAIALLAGAFLVIYGINMLGVLPQLRKVRIPTPKFLTQFIRSQGEKQHAPLFIGLLNGLFIACGPLQAMYLLAAGSGSPFWGASALFSFGLGTLPPLLGFGAIASYLSNSLKHNLVKFSGIFVIILGLLMANNGLTLAGSEFSFNALQTGAIPTNLSNTTLNINVSEGYQIIRMNVTNNGWEPNNFVLQKGVPVKWIINGIEINGCNNRIIVRDYGLDFPINKGEQTIEFAPNKEGVIRWSCWMGMIPGTFIVVNDINNKTEQSTLEQTAPSLPPSTGGCGCGGIG
ncbi:MAG: HMA domain-containing protein [Candidatus Fermentimicrarchaeum limneticum]|uniref:HMA domain-containing protein n=1 Tax=Fermentimicrarchaeum limneticum TaxID=2795018 RepID=A0A7D5XPG7_FERL1|nr:MAG: HMA domain-containing protein [Candidatus Fermentimicrarchaeum limneticum]